ncbi:MAG: RidA family protein [Pyrinomonadaceae bacterium]|nr:RidA family protein [Pyrinomonadaceae bacterium]
MKIRTIQTEKAPAPGGHYSQAVVYNGLVFVAGQLSIEPRTLEKKLGSIEEQTEQALTNVSEILKASGSDLRLVLKMTIYVSDIGLWQRVNAVYARVMGDHRPARAVIPTKELHYGFLVEIDAIAASRD